MTRVHSYLIAPDGEIIDMGIGHHSSWVEDNKDWFERFYGYKIDADLKIIYSHDWIRVSAVENFVGIKIRDYSNFPKRRVEKFLASVDCRNKEIIIEDCLHFHKPRVLTPEGVFDL